VRARADHQKILGFPAQEEIFSGSPTESSQIAEMDRLNGEVSSMVNGFSLD